MKNFLLFGALFLSIESFGQFKLIKDIGGPNIPDGHSIASYDLPVKFNNEIYFTAKSELYGSELFKTDGTSAGTKLFIDFIPGTEGSYPGSFTVAGDKMFFTIDEDDLQHLYVTDGTVEGTKNLDAIVQFGFDMRARNGIVYFRGYDATHGYELWKSDGTTSGTVMVKDVVPGAGSITPGNRTQRIGVTDTHVYFTGTQDGVNHDLWRTDGTDGGTIKLLSNIRIKSSYGFSSIGSTFYFIASDNINGFELWKSDGTVAGTAMLTDMVGDFRATMFSWNNQLFFATNLGGVNYRLHRTDGTVGGTYQIGDIEALPNDCIEYNGKLYYYDKNFLWRTDGTIAGTEKITPPSNDFYSVFGMGVNNNKLYLLSLKGGTEESHVFWTYDETNGLVKTALDFNFYESNQVRKLLVVNNKFFLGVNDGIRGYEPAVSNGIEEPIQLANINKTIEQEYIPQHLTAVGSNVMFAVSDGTHGQELWKTDGTEAGTVLVKDIKPGTEGSSLDNFVAFKGLLLFTANDGAGSLQLWRSDGTDAGTFKLETTIYAPDQTPGIPDANAPTLGGYVFYAGADGNLWKTDGTKANTVMVKPMVFKIKSDFCVVGSKIGFFDNQLRFWTTDGTSGGTTVIFDFPGLLPSANVGSTFYRANNFLYLLGWGGNETQVWRTDGTTAGTSVIKKFLSADGTDIQALGVVNNALLFSSWAFPDTQFGRELWRSDGTASGTAMLKEMTPGPASSELTPVYISGSAAYLLNNYPPYSLWITNGTNNGTIKLKNLYVPASSGAKSFGNHVYFPGITGSGLQLWRSNGTTQGTRSVGKTFEGVTGSFTGEFATTANFLVVVGQSNDHKSALYVLENPDNLPKLDQQINFIAIGNKKTTDQPFALNAESSSELPVTFSIVSGPATVSGSTLTITGPGTVVVKASQAGDENYNPASVERTFDVEMVTGVVDEKIFVSVSPNPAVNQILVRVGSTSSFNRASLFDIYGREVISVDITQPDTQVEIGHLSRGIYLVRISSFDNTTYIINKIILL